MDDVLDETLYHDDFLNRTLNTSTLYEKSNLDLSFLSNDHIDPKHEAHHGDPKTPDSPDLDFLRFGSPDLEQMFLNIDVNEDTDVTNEDAEDVASAAFNIEEDLVSAENCFTEALQHLHDKNETLPVDLLDITFRDDVDDESSVELSAESKLCKSSPTPSPQGCEVMKQCVNINNNNIIINNNTNSHNIISNNNNNNNHNIVNNSNNNNNNNNNDNNDDNNNNNMTNNNNITTVIPSNQLHMKQHGPSMSEIHAQQMYHSDALNNNHPIPPAKALHHQDRTNLMSGPPHHHQQNMAPIATTDITTVIPDQMALNNQIALINSMNQTMTAHQLHQQQQELAFLTQAMNFQAERETMQPHITMNSGYPQHINHIPPHIQHKLIEQQLIHQQLSGGFHGSENNPQLSNLGQHIDAIGIDEHTLKMFVENPHLAPMNMDIQELIKRERKKLRNRIASSKCRKRKLEREGRLEDKVKTLKEKNIELNAVANALKQQICDLKQRVMDHVGEGCQIVLPS